MGESLVARCATDAKALLDVTSKWRATALAGEVEAYIQFLADDAVFLAPNLEPFVGKASVANFVRGAFAAFWFRESMDNRPPMVSGDVGYVWGTYDAEYTSRTDGSKTSERGNHVFVWRRDAPNVWKLVTAVWNTKPQV